MSKNSRQILAGALALILLSSGCGVVARASPTPVWTVPPQGQPISPTATVPAPATSTSTEVSVTPQIPITGENVVSMQCQFCVDEETHAVLIFPDFAYFDVDLPDVVTCLTADVVNGRRILICRGPQATAFNLNICSDSTNCLQFPVNLQPCPLVQTGIPTPFFLAPVNTLKAPTKRPTEPAGTAPALTPTPPATSYP